MQRRLWRQLLPIVAVLVVGVSYGVVSHPSHTQTRPAVTEAIPSDVPAALPLYAMDTTAGMKVREDQYKKRVALQGDFLAAARRLTGKSKNPDMRKLYAFLTSRDFLALPVPGNCMPVQRPIEEGYAVVILLPEDAALGKPWSGLLEKKGAAALYKPGDGRTMILSSDLAGSEEGKALTYLHEGCHVWDDIQFGIRPTTPDTYARGEVRAHERLGRLIDELHPSLAALIGEVASELKAAYMNGDVAPEKMVEIQHSIDYRLDAAYGRTIANQSERGGLVNDILYRAQFRVIDEDPAIPPREKEKEKVLWLISYTENLGNPQW